MIIKCIVLEQKAVYCNFLKHTFDDLANVLFRRKINEFRLLL